MILKGGGFIKYITSYIAEAPSAVRQRVLPFFDIKFSYIRIIHKDSAVGKINDAVARSAAPRARAATRIHYIKLTRTFHKRQVRVPEKQYVRGVFMRFFDYLLRAALHPIEVAVGEKNTLSAKINKVVVRCGACIVAVPADK